MKKLFSYVFLSIIVALGAIGLSSSNVLAAGQPNITGILSFKEVTFGGGEGLADRINVGDRSIIIQGANLLPTSAVRVNGQTVSPAYTSSDQGVDEVAFDIPGGGARAGRMLIEVKLADGTYIGREYTVEGVVQGPTPTPTPNTTPPGNVPPGTVTSNLTCTEQGLVKDANTGLCLPANPLSPNANSLAKATSIGGLIKRILDILLTLGGVVAILFIVIGGYQYVTSRGSESQAKEGQKTITYAVIGLVAMLLAFMLVTVVTNLFTQGNVF